MKLSSPKEGVKNSCHYYCSMDSDKRHRRTHLFSSLVIVLCVLLTVYWLHHGRQRTILQRIHILRNENRRFLPMLSALSMGDVKDRSGEMAHGHDQVGLRFDGSQAVYDAEAMRAFIIGVLGSHQPLTEQELDGVVLGLTRDVPEMVPHRQLEHPTPCWTTDEEKLLCLPGAYILGFKRSAWTDLFYRLASHPDIVQSWRVEDKFLARASAMDFREIVRNYGVNVQVNNFFKPGLLLEGNPDDFLHAASSFLAEIDMPRSLLVAQIIRRLTPNAKLVVILRNPVEAALSYYVFRRRPNLDSKADFHAFMDGLIKEVHNVTYNEGLDACYGKSHLHENLLYWTYIVYLQDYLTIFPEENVYFVRTEDYADKIRREEILQELFDFLGVGPLDFDALKYLSGMGPQDDESKKWHNPALQEMMKNTSEMISSFFEPFNDILAEMLSDRRFIWPGDEEAAEVQYLEDEVKVPSPKVLKDDVKVKSPKVP